MTRPKVPSEPTNTLLRLYPADDFLGLRLVLMTVPSERTTVKFITQSFIVPYLTAFVPEQLVPIIPPIFALGPGAVLKLVAFPGPPRHGDGAPMGRKSIRRTRINREEQSAIHTGQLGVQILPTNARLYYNVHVVLVELDDLVHVGEVNTNAPVRRREVALEAGSSGVRNDGHPVFVAYPSNDGHLLGGSWVRNRNRETIWVNR